jgi:hypothetical protein
MMLMAQKTRSGLKIMAVALVCCGILIPGLAWTTTQFSDILFLDGQKHFLDSLPLEQYYGSENPRPDFRWPNTATWRGYIATWEIINNVLYLKSIRAWTSQGEVGLAVLFPGRKGPVPATWFTGQLKVPHGKILKPGVPQPLYEQYLILTVEKGRVIKRDRIDHPGGDTLPER